MVAERKVVPLALRDSSHYQIFGYGDVEDKPLNSVLIQMPDASLGSFRLVLVTLVLIMVSNLCPQHPLIIIQLIFLR